MKFEELLTRADTAIIELMPDGALPLVKAIDPALAYPRNLIKVLLKLKPPSVLLDDPITRDHLLLMLGTKEAEKLAGLVGWDGVGSAYDCLLSVPFQKSVYRQQLFRFLDVQIPAEEARAVLRSRENVTPIFSLFPHQAKALREVEAHLNISPHRVLLHMPTGAGKTRTAMNVVTNYLRTRDKGVVVWLAHSEELCEQAYGEFIKAWQALGIRETPAFRFWGSYEEDLRQIDDGLVVVGLKKAYSRLAMDSSHFRTLSKREPLVVIDEAHQAIAPTYKLIINQLMRPLAKTQLLGLSATPGRSWNDPSADRELSEFFATKKVTLKVEGFSNPVEYLIHAGYLARPEFSRINTSTKVSLTTQESQKIRETFDIPDSVLNRLADDEKRNLLIVHHAEQLLMRHSRVILFATSVRQSDLLAAVLSARGHWAYSITSKSANDRSALIADFKNNDEQPKILCNYGVLTTGFDAPKVSAALIARPTLSLVLYSQMVGRAMRGILAGGNRVCEIMTVVDTTLPGFDSVVDAFSNWEDVWSNDYE